MAAIAQSADGRVNPSDLVKQLGFSAQSSIQKAFPGLITGADGRVYYQRQPSEAWKFAIELLARALAQDTPVPDTFS